MPSLLPIESSYCELQSMPSQLLWLVCQVEWHSFFVAFTWLQTQQSAEEDTERLSLSYIVQNIILNERPEKLVDFLADIKSLSGLPFEEGTSPFRMSQYAALVSSVSCAEELTTLKNNLAKSSRVEHLFQVLGQSITCYELQYKGKEGAKLSAK